MNQIYFDMDDAHRILRQKDKFIPNEFLNRIWNEQLLHRCSMNGIEYALIRMPGKHAKFCDFSDRLK